MTILRRGITGFDTAEEVDVATFKKAVYHAAHKAGATVVLTIVGDSVTPNFHQTEIQIGERSIAIICNRSFPVVAFVRTPVEMDEVHPIDLVEFVDPVRDFGFDVATPVELNRPIAPSDLEVLGDRELEQVKYWKPKRIGQLVFNWWD